MGQPLVWRHLVKLPQDRKVARVYGLWRVHGGSFRTRLPTPASALCASGSPAKVSYVTTALYRRYRPETFQDVIGQEHVTEPLMTALRKNRVNHAYLFSGPRGCGKTTSARILARCLNCAEGPTATPCGHCESCQDLARDGAGSLDVIEMDAASHGGVDHARDLRERATFAPVRDRYKIFIIDEAHMVTREGFNALLKIVEEPPEHVKFIFATTEPSKVLTTIRSRTHHYPFRLVPPEPLMRYLEQLCQEEGVTTEPGVLSLVVRAGGGSVRDSLSVLDQLMAGSEDGGITYDLAVALLGYTHAALLDDVVDAFAAGDAATVFASVDRVIQTGQDPRRFVEDLLERFRDLVVVNAVPDSAANILHGMPTDQINRLRNQATQLGAAELSRSADITNEALNEMTGATSPQLHLELLCARILLPSADHTTRGITSRVDRLERRLSIPRGTGIRTTAHDAASSSPAVEPTARGSQEPTSPEQSGTAAPAPASYDAPAPESAGVPSPIPPEFDAAATDSVAPSQPVRPDGSAADGADGSATGRPAEETPDVQEPTDPQDESEQPEGSSHPAAADPVPEGERGPDAQHPPADGTTDTRSPASQDAGADVSARMQQRETSNQYGSQRPDDDASRQYAQGEPRRDVAPHDDHQPQAPQASEEQAAPSDVTSGELELLRSSWPEIVSALAEIRRVAWAITVRGTPISFENRTLRIAFENDGDLLNFPRFEADVRNAIQSVVGLDCAVEAVRPGDTRGRQDTPGAGGPPSNAGRGTGPGPGRDGGGGQGYRGDRPAPRGGGPQNAQGSRQDRGSQQDRSYQRDDSASEHGQPYGPGPRQGSDSHYGADAGYGSGSRRDTGASRGDGPTGRDTRLNASGQARSSDQPDYFREPEGFGVNRRRGNPPAPDREPTPERESRSMPDSASRSTSGTDRSSVPASSSHSAPASAPDDDEPVTSWSVASIPQPGFAAPSGGDSTSNTADAAPTRDDSDQNPDTSDSSVGDSSRDDAHRATDSPADDRAGTGDSTSVPSREGLGSDSDSADVGATSWTPGAPASDGPGSHVPASDDSAAFKSHDSGAGTSGPDLSMRDGSMRDGSVRDGSVPEDPASGAPSFRAPQPRDRGPEYWSPEEPPPPPEDDPPADMYDEPVPRAPSPARDRRAQGGNGPGGDNPAGPGPDHDGRGNTRPGGVVPRENGDTRPGGNRPSWRERHAEAIAAAERRSTDIAPPTSRSPGMEDENFVPGADDESLEDSSLYGRAAIERILGGMLIDEHAHGTDQ